MVIRSKPTSKAIREPWHSVSIVPGKNPCDAVLANPRRRTLSREAPRLPVAGCSDPEHCQCRYQHHADRHAGPRRNEDSGGGTGTGTAPAKNRRRPGERRARN
jgi:hypothetical protein